MHASARCVTVAIAICSWFAISNHCALAALETRADSAKNECPFHSKPAKHSHVQCCKILRAVAPVIAKSWARDDAKFSDLDLRFEEFALIALSCGTKTPLLLDTGPPGAHSFAELILQRSLLTHAPPILA